MSELERAVETVVGPCLGIQRGRGRGDRRRPHDRVGSARRCATPPRGSAPSRSLCRDGAARGRRAGAAGGGRGGARARRTVFIAPTRRSLSHTRARKAASEAGARGATLPGVTEDMLARLMACRLPARWPPAAAASPTCSRGADEAHVTCPLGTRPAARPDAAARASPTTATSPRRARSATCPAARASSRRSAARATLFAATLAIARPARRARRG